MHIESDYESVARRAYSGDFYFHIRQEKEYPHGGIENSDNRYYQVMNVFETIAVGLRKKKLKYVWYIRLRSTFWILTLFVTRVAHVDASEAAFSVFALDESFYD